MSARGDGRVAAQLARGGLADVPVDAVRAGLRLPLHDYLDIELTGLHPTTLEVPLSERTRSLTASLHGGVTATLVDVAANIAVATGGAVDITAWRLVTTRLELAYRAQPTGGRVRCVARAGEPVGRRVVTTCEVSDETARTVATAEVTTLLIPGGFDIPGLSELSP